MTDSNPPAYETVTNHLPNDHLAGKEQYTLILDNCTIYPSEPPSRILYEITNPPCNAPTTVYGVQKVRYRLSDHDGEGSVKFRLDHIYDFQNKYFHSLRDLRTPVVLQGKTSKKRSYKEIKLSGGMSGWSTCTADGHFKAEIAMGDRFKKDAQIQWKNKRGVVVAVESRLMRKEDGTVEVLPRLDVREVLEEKDLDLLVSCWAARLWKEAEGDLKQPLTWEDCKCPFFFPLLAKEVIRNLLTCFIVKRIAGQKRRFGKTTMLTGGLGVAGASAAF